MNKVFWAHNELPFAKFLNSFRDSLVKDFTRTGPTLDSVEYAKPVLEQGELGLNYQEKLTTNGVPDITAWRALPFKYKRREKIDFTLPANVVAKFPTAAKIVRHFGDKKCNTAMYSLLAPRTVIKEHRDGEDLERQFVRVHIPLVVPEGDCYFQIDNQQHKWDNIWAFDTQEPHSAYNNTDQWRLVFIMDLKRSEVGLA